MTSRARSMAGAGASKPLAGLLCVLAGVGLGARDAPRQDAPKAPLTLALAVHQALDRGERAIAARDQLEQAGLSLRLARSAFTPKVASNLFGSFGQTDVSNQTYGLTLAERFTTGTEVRANLGASTSQNQFGNFYSTDATLLVSQPLLRGFGRAVTRRELTTAEAAVAEAERRNTLTAQQVALEAASAYYRIVTEQQLVAIAEKAYERAVQLREASTAKLSVGRVSRLDVVRAEQLVAETDLQLLNAKAAVDDAKDQLRLLMGDEGTGDFEVAAEVAITHDSMTEDEAVKTALARRVDLKSADESVAEAERNVAVSANQLRPQLDLNLALTRRETADRLLAGFGVDRFKLATFATLSLPFDRTAQAVGLETAQIDLNARTRARATLRASIGLEVRRSVRSLARLEKTLTLADANLASAAQEAELAHLRFERGLSNNLDVVNAETAVLSARSRAVQVRAELALAHLQLRAATGLLDPRTDVR